MLFSGSMFIYQRVNCHQYDSPTWIWRVRPFGDTKNPRSGASTDRPPFQVPSRTLTLNPHLSQSIPILSPFHPKRIYPLVNQHRPWQIGFGRLVSIKNGRFSGSMLIYQRVTPFGIPFFYLHDTCMTIIRHDHHDTCLAFDLLEPFFTSGDHPHLGPQKKSGLVTLDLCKCCRICIWTHQVYHDICIYIYLYIYW